MTSKETLEQIRDLLVEILRALKQGAQSTHHYDAVPQQIWPANQPPIIGEPIIYDGEPFWTQCTCIDEIK